MIVINLVGGPGSGKSTVMAGLFYKLKKRGINCEMTPEYAKDKVMDDQIYMFAKQLHKFNRLKDKVDIIITDGSLLNSVVYDKTKSKPFRNLVLDQFRLFENHTFFINRRVEQYKQEGRIETVEESMKLDEEYLKLMEEENIPYKQISNIDAVNFILDEII